MGKIATAFSTLMIFASCVSSPKTEITWIEDKPAPTYQAYRIFPEVSDTLWSALKITEDGVPSSMSCVLLQTEGKNILIDAGLGAPFSRLLTTLSGMGLSPEDIDCVFLTHLHGDHIGGLLDEGKAVFGNAAVYVEAKEAEAWKSMPSEKNVLQMSLFDAYGDKIRIFDAGDTLEGNVKSLEAYGHTPGHTIFEKDGYLIIGDLIHGAALQVPHPEYCAFFDMDKDSAVSARRKYLEYAKEKGLKIYGMHLPAPGTLEQ